MGRSCFRFIAIHAFELKKPSLCYARIKLTKSFYNIRYTFWIALSSAAIFSRSHRHRSGWTSGGTHGERRRWVFPQWVGVWGGVWPKTDFGVFWRLHDAHFYTYMTKSEGGAICLSVPPIPNSGGLVPCFPRDLRPCTLLRRSIRHGVGCSDIVTANSTAKASTCSVSSRSNQRMTEECCMCPACVFPRPTVFTALRIITKRRRNPPLCIWLYSTYN